jgi:hypothetical protein
LYSTLTLPDRVTFQKRILPQALSASNTCDRAILDGIIAPRRRRKQLTHEGRNPEDARRAAEESIELARVLAGDSAMSDFEFASPRRPKEQRQVWQFAHFADMLASAHTRSRRRLSALFDFPANCHERAEATILR